MCRRLVLLLRHSRTSEREDTEAREVLMDEKQAEEAMTERERGRDGDRLNPNSQTQSRETQRKKERKKERETEVIGFQTTL